MVVVLLLWPAIAVADTGPAGGGYVDDTGTPVAEAASSSSGGGAGSQSAPPCRYLSVAENPTVYDLDGTVIHHDGPGNWFIKVCYGGPGGSESSNFAVWIPSDPAALAEQAREELPLTLPDVHTSPDASGEQLVGVATWLWVTGAWSPQSTTASVPGVSVTVTATPVAVVWSMGDGGRVVCSGPGTPYDPSRPSDQQATDCSYTYQHSSAGQRGDSYPASATVTWDVSWSANGIAGGGALGSVTRTTTFSLRVAEAQALNE